MNSGIWNDPIGSADSQFISHPICRFKILVGVVYEYSWFCLSLLFIYPLYYYFFGYRIDNTPGISLQRSPLLTENILFLNQGVNLLNRIDDQLYLETVNSFYGSGVGKHVRHVLDHYSCVIHHTDGKIDYFDRERNPRIENNRRYALTVAREILDELRGWNENLLDKEIKVRNNTEVNTSEGGWSRSSLRREFQFLISHTVHHYALIALILQSNGFTPDESFGVAPSTLRYRAEKKD